MYYVYIMSGHAHRLYVGVTNNLERRVLKHKSGVGSAFTSKYNLTELVFYDSFHEVNDAIAAEKRIKGWRREKKVALIEKTNPYWHDLADYLDER